MLGLNLILIAVVTSFKYVLAAPKSISASTTAVDVVSTASTTATSYSATFPALILASTAFAATTDPVLSVSTTTSATSLVSSITVSPVTLPKATLDSATITGVNSDNGLTKFLGIHFVQPPTGNRRFRNPEPLPPYAGNLTATQYGPSCPQQSLPPVNAPDIVGSEAFQIIEDELTTTEKEQSEDCLTINIIRPQNVTKSDKLPVVLWIHGGDYDAAAVNLVRRSIEIGQPVIYASMNYRLNGFGFLASKEVRDAGIGNLGLKDQREAMRWVQRYINAFGGDPKKVTFLKLTSASADGATSVSYHMLSKTHGLYRGAFMESGAPWPVGSITNGQEAYDFLVSQTGCSGSHDTLSCLRHAPYDSLKAAIDKTPSYDSYRSLDLVWMPRTDGDYLREDPDQLIRSGSVVNVPMVSGCVEDEGTVFSFTALNITTSQQFKAWVKKYFLRDVTDADLDKVLYLYPADPSQGSPFGTGSAYALTPQYKRIAAFLGDIIFQGPRRFFLQQRSGQQRMWSYLSRNQKNIPYIAAYHGSEFVEGSLIDYLVHFAYKLDPNGISNGSISIHWPEYTTEHPNLYLLPSSGDPAIIQDSFRQDAISELIKLSAASPLR
ncbi:Alpha/Beta hydrolase protein [Crucibulum laeve]|uniref:Alpha/Beta hydrolase protein n=1 Tax=Crucibulum laeve TaxID=68775 RepID=A0A5C3LNV0_9AGAR|nr:Alpha/Beta hydrolase protein [Crucibulum laeve]